MLWVVLSVLYSLDPRDCYTDLPKLVERCIGETITITPDFVGYPTTPVLDWTNIPGDGRHKVHQNGTLVIRNAQVEDSDMYSYLVHSEEEFTLALFNLSITECREPTTPTSVIKTSTASSTRDGVSVTPTARDSSITSTTGDIVTVTPTSREDPLTTRLTAETERLPTSSKTRVPATSNLPTSSPLETPVLVTSKILPTSTPQETPALVTSGDVTSEIPSGVSLPTEDLPSSSYRVVSSPPTEATVSKATVSKATVTKATVTKPFISSTTPGGEVDNLSGNSECLLKGVGVFVGVYDLLI